MNVEIGKWIKFGQSWREFSTPDENGGCGLAKPGTAIEIIPKSEKNQKRRVFLIGDINRHGGVCDDCMDFDRDSTVTRYKIVIGKY